MKKGIWIPLVVLSLGTALGLSSYSATAADAIKQMCPYANFPNLSNSVGAGTNYAKPDVSVACTASEVIVESNGMISFPFVKMTPNSLKEQDWTWHIPLAPKVASSTTSIKNVLGTLGFTVTGLPIYGPTEGPMPSTQAFGDPAYNKILDSCGGHTGPSSEYHQHAIYSPAQCNLSKQSVVGYALDGFPIYNNVGCVDKACKTTVKLTSGYVMVGNPTTNSWDAYNYVKSSKSTVLDACNGRIEPDGTYGYHVTETFPYIIGCYKGTPTQQAGNAGAAMAPMNVAPQRNAVPQRRPEMDKKKMGPPAPPAPQKISAKN
ncbi:MAG: YHYH protein [Actinobacteria bacterium]|nr:YHYH protein [Actinomycetota bacterium]